MEKFQNKTKPKLFKPKPSISLVTYEDNSQSPTTTLAPNMKITRPRKAKKTPKMLVSTL